MCVGRAPPVMRGASGRRTPSQPQDCRSPRGAHTLPPPVVVALFLFSPRRGGCSTLVATSRSPQRGQVAVTLLLGPRRLQRRAQPHSQAPLPLGWPSLLPSWACLCSKPACSRSRGSREGTGTRGCCLCCSSLGTLGFRWI